MAVPDAVDALPAAAAEDAVPAAVMYRPAVARTVLHAVARTVFHAVARTVLHAELRRPFLAPLLRACAALRCLKAAFPIRVSGTTITHL